MKTFNLPADPDQMNDERAVWAAKALKTFQKITKTDYDDALADLLTDLMHWADREGFNFIDELERARSHYGFETEKQ